VSMASRTVLDIQVRSPDDQSSGIILCKSEDRAGEIAKPGATRRVQLSGRRAIFNLKRFSSFVAPLSEGDSRFTQCVLATRVRRLVTDPPTCTMT
jgi:hypothetical protein